jgi:hypothetical protein
MYKIGDQVKILEGLYSGEDAVIIKRFTSMLGGLKLLVELENKKEVWISEADLEYPDDEGDI